ncbi:unnamed protein product [Kluyveromyces dobzhanskii CBS 2104]|uniref:WGS project CCBQ000000000 data, contig 00008 n=1 Tax=Kluyveromyces dobzhanskii CBS 2104 TaxID=1427455 RepID=A0A0A8L7J3_9SACH|nr:unnamed protein product [Kluyveromyces dobzhanskii CBS 2104]
MTDANDIQGLFENVHKAIEPQSSAVTRRKRKRDRLSAHFRHQNDKITATFFVLQDRLSKDIVHIKSHLHNRRLEFKASTMQTLKKWKGVEDSFQGPITFEIASDVESSFVDRAAEDTLTFSYFPTKNNGRQFNHNVERKISDVLFETAGVKPNSVSLRSSSETNWAPIEKDESYRRLASNLSFLEYFDASSDSTSNCSSKSSQNESCCSLVIPKNNMNTGETQIESELNTKTPFRYPNSTYSNEIRFTEIVPLEPSFEDEKHASVTKNLHGESKGEFGSKVLSAWEFKDGRFFKVSFILPNENDVEWDIDKTEYKHFSLKELLKRKRLNAAAKMYAWVRQNYINDSVIT